MNGTRQHDGASTCSLCPNFLIDTLSGPDLLKHMGAHILHDNNLRGSPSPCRFCLNSQCEIHLTRHGRNLTIDMQKSRCPNLRKIHLKIAESFTERQPCTNHPLKCPLCTSIIWKYNLKTHITEAHSNANLSLYESLYRLHGSELTLMKGVFLARNRSSKNNLNKRTNLKALAISTGHSSRLALQCDFISFTLSTLILPALPRPSEDSEDDENLGVKAAEDMSAHDEEDVDYAHDEVNTSNGPSEDSEPTEDSNNGINDTSEVEDFQTNEYQTVETDDELASPDTIQVGAGSGTFGYNFQISPF